MQSVKGKSHWRKWMESSARLSPKTRGISDLKERVARLTTYENWRKPRKISFVEVVDADTWEQHKVNWRAVLELLERSQILAKEIRQIVAKAKSLDAIE
ncbi:hypothetical protein [Granulicella sp. L60]|uniref:hypothetical protein n=1 Tax=Granulicella sp. L60 TaxID=1641866 RepID=UPI001C206280|nr:hypothetical protein [Granulicella sp. L60]